MRKSTTKWPMTKSHNFPMGTDAKKSIRRIRNNQSIYLLLCIPAYPLKILQQAIIDLYKLCFKSGWGRRLAKAHPLFPKREHHPLTILKLERPDWGNDNSPAAKPGTASSAPWCCRGRRRQRWPSWGWWRSRVSSRRRKKRSGRSPPPSGTRSAGAA